MRLVSSILAAYLLLNSIPLFGQQKDTINLYFAVNQYKLNSWHRVELNRLLNRFSEITYISITGHADTTGSPQYNLQLSRKRSVSVKNYLFQIGLDTLIRDFNYYGESNAVMPFGQAGTSFSRGSGVLSDRRVETIAEGNAMPVNAETSASLPEEFIEVNLDDLPPVLPHLNNPVEPQNTLIRSKLNNGVEVAYLDKTFPDFIENKMDRGDETLIYFADDINLLKQFKMITVTDDNKVLAPAKIVCFDSLSFTRLQKDSAVVLKIPLNYSIDCPAATIKLYSSVKSEGIWKWHEQENPLFTREEGGHHVTLPVKSFHGCMNFAYEIQPPCFNPVQPVLKLKNLTFTQVIAFIPSINCLYIPAKKEQDSYQIFLHQPENSYLLFDFVARDNKNKIYNLRNFPLTMCKYDSQTNTYLLTKKDLQRFLKSNW